jgi:TetR/AcrR family transcriptional repressor of nem operon
MRKGELARLHIIEKSAPVFNLLGYGRTSLSHLTEATGFEKSGIYRHFSSKEDLACQAFDYTCQMAWNTKFASLNDLPTGIAKVEGFIRNFFSIRSPIPGGCPIYNNAVYAHESNPALKKRSQKGYRTWVNALKEFINEAKAEGDIRANIDSEKLASFLLVSLEGSLIANNLVQRVGISNDTADELIDYLKTKHP